jgi:predicted NAD/FAD-dependent oxidoreductase
MSLNKSKIAIIGTGMTALSIGYHLPSLYPSIEITYFDKGLKPGGRLATRRTRKNKEFLFDHGAPYFT